MHARYFKNDTYSPDRNTKAWLSLGDTTGLDSIINGIEANKTNIEQKITTALADCRGYLKNDTITVYIAPSDQGMRKVLQSMGGINSWTENHKAMVLVIDSRIRNWTGMLQYCVAREYNHAFSWDKMNQGALLALNLLDRIVAEGKADAYGHLLYPDVKCPWDTALGDEEIQYQWGRMKMELRSEDYYMIQGIMFGSDNYPAFTGYNVGYVLVESALKNNPNLTPEQWTNLSPGWILELSDYKTGQ